MSLDDKEDKNFDSIFDAAKNILDFGSDSIFDLLSFDDAREWFEREGIRVNKRKRFYRKSQVVIDAIKKNLDSIDGAVSTRQMYYLLISIGVIPPTNSGYNKVQRLLVELRREGIIESDRICDRTRNKHKRPSWNGLTDILEQCKVQYRRDYWSEQDIATFIAVEKQALEGVFSEVCDEYGVALFVLRGYPSYSLLYDWSQEIIELNGEGKEVKIYYFGDFDATGVHIDESVAGQILDFGAKFSFERIGVLPEDIEKFNLMTLPVKHSDTRAKAFIEKYGHKCVELDALPPNELKRRIREVIGKNIDVEKWERMYEIEAQEQKTLGDFIENLPL